MLRLAHAEFLLFLGGYLIGVIAPRVKPVRCGRLKMSRGGGGIPD